MSGVNGELADHLFRAMVKRAQPETPICELDLTTVRARAYRAALSVTRHVYAVSAEVDGESLRVCVAIGWRVFFWGRRMRVWSRVWAELCEVLAEQRVLLATPLERVVVEVCR